MENIFQTVSSRREENACLFSMLFTHPRLNSPRLCQIYNPLRLTPRVLPRLVEFEKFAGRDGTAESRTRSTGLHVRWLFINFYRDGSFENKRMNAVNAIKIVGEELCT